MKKMMMVALLAASVANAAPISVRDDDGNVVTLQKPAQRVIAMAPHVTELLFTAGAGDKIVGAVTYSDYPEAARKIPRVGDNRLIDLERVAAMKPDLIVIWMHGGFERQIEGLRKLGIPLFHSEPTKLEGIADNVVRLGQLMGTETVANAAAEDIRQQFAAMTRQYAKRPPVRLFYQVWDKPLYTLSNKSIVSDAIRLCGGVNIFGDLKVTAPVVSVEAVLQENPEAIFGTSEKDYGSVNLWKPYPNMLAVKNNNLFRLEGELLNRAGPRMVVGTKALCEKIEEARQHRN
ncbi:iron complex transport system substrate-binding protein [Duganella sp. CF402]|uniref:cobalamin-binding protein n=1 Tax=unclassified Duganella TaxID=2636909 RepID=UPI0008CA9C04|nr:MULTISPECIES: cobalamin-binding protein [unclassified Duganella]RZT01260.1 iron complex transport system substrate-binding protein [Duganella sp. BK701]SEN23280.1 iron complex transport system substrate-binding protein [Duganella sp. CF402]